MVLVERNPFCGGNSTKATSGINGAETQTQKKKGIPDTIETFKKDIFKSSTSGKAETPYALGGVLAEESKPAIDWLINAFDLDLSLVSRLGGHSEPRTHRGKERFPGMTITYALMEKFEKLCKEQPDRARILTKSKVTELTAENGVVTGVKYVTKDGK